MFWAPQPGPQFDAIQADWCPELFFGGARGGGKSAFLLGDYLQDVENYKSAWQGVIFRRTYPELQELIRQAFEFYTPTGATWREQAKEFEWPNGAILRFRYLEHERDATRYQGHQYTWIAWDELQQWANDTAYKMMFATLRSTKDVKTKRVRATGNPGGVGHQWIKNYFIDPAISGYKPIFDQETGQIRLFIPSKVDDNKILLQSDPNYKDRLKRIGSPELVRAWLEGDWSVIAGAFFSEFELVKHVVRPFKIPEHWMRFCSMDWGSYRPFCVHWFAVSDGQFPEYPRGSLILYREWYGSTGEPNVGLKMFASDVARGILARESESEKISNRVADPSIFKEDGGPSIAEEFRKAGVAFFKADNSRDAGHEQIRTRLIGEEKPMLFIFNNCKDIIRTLPAVQHDDKKPEDIDTDSEDHAVDCMRYGLMSRPWIKNNPKPVERFKGLADMTYNDLFKMHERTLKTKKTKFI